MSLKDQVVIVTGAGGGIGRAAALLLGRLGARVVVNDYGGDTAGQAGDIGRAQAVADEIRAAGGEATANGEPVGSVRAAEKIRDAALAAYGRIDALINNAGIMAIGEVDEISDALLDRVIEINFLGAFRLLRAVWPGMKARGYGRIVNVSSSSLLGFGDRAPYGAAKAALIGLTADAAFNGKPHGILVNSLLPAAFTRLTNGEAGGADAIDPAMWEMLREKFAPEFVASTAAFLVSPKLSITGEHIVSGANRVARLAHFETAGWRKPGLTMEDIALNIAEVRDTRRGAFVASGQEELALFMPAPEAVVV
jgi:NAD(P)-dependent dehydrogenase (short-subunit alcohol dehydrogenase family)